ncbi:DUF1015 domain-containing protein [Trichloromonas sp.]|uniref:DUF1015 domain-containing protein n=1 Tax=Trichloromonas sp. TaxID=3069249 RepID=UPI002A4644A2|nr:DUF1015 domain-containing protein [Trichloromonas sp.]
MAKIVPFRGLRYSAKRIAELAQVTAPPYDVISPNLQEELHRRHEYNIVRLILGRTRPEDSAEDNRYIRAAALLRQWRLDGILVRDAEPSIYLYDQEYADEDGGTLTRNGIITLARIEEFSTGLVKPHEKTLADPKADRLALIKACQANLTPVFSLYSDPCCVLEVLAKKEKDRPPEVDVRDDDGVHHRLWCCSDSTLIGKAQALLDNKPVVLADGHHRYEAAIAYRDYMRQLHPDYTGKELFNYVLMCFSNMEDKGMRIFPAHRVVSGLAGFDRAAFFGRLADYFDIESQVFDPQDDEQIHALRAHLSDLGSHRHTLALFAGDGRIHYLSLRDEGVMDDFFDEKTPKVLRTLDISILHHLLFEGLLGIAPDDSERLRYIRGIDEALGMVVANNAQLAFLVNPTRMSEVRDVANAGGKMPQKSTYFYPKILSGMVINPIE